SLLADPDRGSRRDRRARTRTFGRARYTSPYASRAGDGDAAPSHAAGRWSIFAAPPDAAGPEGGAPTAEQRIEATAHRLLRRGGVVSRALLRREPRVEGREVAPVFRRMEARGELRGGRFVAGFVGEQFALPEALEALRALRASSRNGDAAN